MCPVRQLLAYMCIKPTTTKHQSDDHHEITNQLLSYQNILLFLNFINYVHIHVKFSVQWPLYYQNSYSKSMLIQFVFKD